MTRIDESIEPVLRALGDALVSDPIDRDLRGIFEHEVQRLVGLRSVRLREIPARYHARLVTPTAGDERSDGIADSLMQFGGSTGLGEDRLADGARGQTPFGRLFHEKDDFAHVLTRSLAKGPT